MKSSIIIGLISLATCIFAQPKLILMEPEPADTSNNFQLIWETIPGIKYELKHSTDLQSWNSLSGWPKTAPQTSDKFNIDTATESRRFFKVILHDEQGPQVITRIPDDQTYAIKRNNSIFVVLKDASEINTNSITLNVEGVGLYDILDNELEFEENGIVFNGNESISLGGYGETINVVLIVSDINGYASTNSWSFNLETNPETSNNIFVFGSPSAQTMGQTPSTSPTQVIAERMRHAGVQLMNSVPPTWELDSVTSNSVIITYTSANAPTFTNGWYIANATPMGPNDMFYRQITAQTNDTIEKILTLHTIDVNLEDMITEGSLGLSKDSLLLESTDGTTFSSLAVFSKTFELPEISYSRRNESYSITYTNNSTAYTAGLNVHDAYITIKPELQTMMEISWGKLKQFKAITHARIEKGYDVGVEFSAAYSGKSGVLFKGKAPSLYIYVGQIGIVPVFISVQLTCECGYDLQSAIATEFDYGFHQTAFADFGVTYKEGSGINSIKRYVPLPPTVPPFNYSINGSLNACVTLKPRLEVLVNQLAGIAVGPTAKAEIDITGAYSSQANTSDQFIQALNTGLNCEGSLNAAVSLDIESIGPAFDLARLKLSYSKNIWSNSWPLFSTDNIGETTRTPTNIIFTEGEGFVLPAEVSLYDQNNSDFQWYNNGIPLPGQTNSFLSFTNQYQSYDAGRYSLRIIRDNNQYTYTEPSEVSITPPESNTDHYNSILITPDTMNAFYMDDTEVTNDEMARVMQWAYDQGKIFFNAYDEAVFNSSGNSQILLNLDSDHCGVTWDGSTFGTKDLKGDGYPCVAISWYGAAAYCNFRSEMEDRNVCYDFSDWSVNLTANGYRLPAQDEWEYAARGGLSAKLYPWGNTISFNEANYYSSGTTAYGNNAPLGYHPDYNDGMVPYTNPVKDFSANGYNLYGMAGNVFEWCQDDGGGSDAKKVRGGSWTKIQSYSRCSLQYELRKDYAGNDIGLRPVRNQ